jgi:hypothetical protein
VVKKVRSGFQFIKPDKFVRYLNGFNKMAAKFGQSWPPSCFYHLKTGHKKCPKSHPFEYRTVRYSVAYCTQPLMYNNLSGNRIKGA